MSDSCDRTPEIERAHASGEWPAELSAHAATCASCGDTRLVLDSLATLAGTDAAFDEPPPAAALFRGYHLTERLRREQREAARVARPLRIAEIAAGVASFVGALLLAGRAEASPTTAGFLWVWTIALLLTSASVLARSVVGEE